MSLRAQFCDPSMGMGKDCMAWLRHLSVSVSLSSLWRILTNAESLHLFCLSLHLPFPMTVDLRGDAAQGLGRPPNVQMLS